MARRRMGNTPPIYRRQYPYPGKVRPGQAAPWRNRKLMKLRGMLGGQWDANVGANQINLAQNRINESGPFGGRTYTQNPNNGQWEMNTSVGQGMQSRIDATQNYQQLNPDSKMRQGIESKIMGAWENRNKSQNATDWENFRQRMADQGIPENSAQYKQQADLLSQQQSDARLQEQARATELAGQEQQRQFGMQSTAQNMPFQQMQSMAQTQATMQGGFQPTYTDTMQPIDVTRPSLQMYEWKKQEPQRYQWDLGKIAAQGDIDRAIAEMNMMAAAANAGGSDKPPPEGEQETEEEQEGFAPGTQNPFGGYNPNQVNVGTFGNRRAGMGVAPAGYAGQGQAYNPTRRGRPYQPRTLLPVGGRFGGQPGGMMGNPFQRRY